MLFAPVLLTIRQPDLGTGLIIALIAFFMLAVARYHVRTLLYIGGAGLLAIPLAWFVLPAGMSDELRQPADRTRRGPTY